MDAHGTPERGRFVLASESVQILTSACRHKPWTIVKIVGELDVVGGPELREAVIRIVQEGDRHLILDFTDVDFIDSFGLGVLVGSLKRVRLLDGDLQIVVPEARLRRVFEVCDLDRIFELHVSVDAAAGYPHD